MPSEKKPNQAQLEQSWIRDMGDIEEAAGGFSGASGALAATRARALQKIPEEFNDWSALEVAIRSDIPRKFLIQVKKEIAVDDLPGAMRSIWRAVIHDLRSKVIAFGIQHFAALDGMPSLKDENSLRTLVTDYKLIEGCRALNIITPEAYVHFSHSRQLVEGYADSDDFTESVDRLELLNFIKNAVKYSLSIDQPNSGFDIQGLVAQVDEEDLRSKLCDFETALQTAPGAAGTLIRLLFRRIVEPELRAKAEANILMLFPLAWKHASDKERRAVGEDFVHVRLSGSTEQGRRALDLLLSARGAQYLPDAILHAYIQDASQALLNAHNGYSNFAAEIGPAERLMQLGPRIPEASQELYVRAVTICFLGNPYGVSVGAFPYLEAMVDAFNSPLVRKLSELLIGDLELRSTLLSERPASRLSVLLGRVLSRASGGVKEKLLKLTELSTPDVIKQFTRPLHAPT